ncbi:MAG TPA: sigma-70 family RNA polymerase sigma factor [Verrucomicrobiae bacterium]|nr:sigma-70 family RNA polymerase sigma factor [Verrucomicrobiae bacterium]
MQSQRDAFWESRLAATRQSLLTRLRQHDDHTGWQRFFDTYGGVIRGLAIKAGLSDTEADDALQETLLSVAKEIPGFRYDPARGSFKGWLFTIARRRIADQFRIRVRRQRDGNNQDDIIEETPNLAADPLGALWEDEWRQSRIQRAVERVKKKVAANQWQMFDLAVLQRLPTERICQLLGINRAQLYMAKMRVGRALKAEVETMPLDGPLDG